MKTLTEKYRAIQENKYTKAQFLRDARLALPQFITQYNGYDDAVSILKSKGMITEGRSKYIQMHITGDGGKEVGKYFYPASWLDDMKHPGELGHYMNAWIKNMTPMEDKYDYVIRMSQGTNEPDPDAIEITQKDLEDAKKIKAIVMQRARNISNRGYEKAGFKPDVWSRGIDPNMDLNEEYDYQGQPNYSLDALERGVDVELEKMGLNSALAPKEEELEKAKKTAIKNLEKNPNHYVELVAGDHTPKGDADQMVAATKSNTVDKKNGMVKAKLKEAVKTLIVNALNESTEEKEKVLTEISMSDWKQRYNEFEGIEIIVNKLEDLIEEIAEQKKTAVDKLTEIFGEVGETVKNKEGIKVGSFIAPGLVDAFRIALRDKIGPHNYEPRSIPRVKVLSKKEFDDMKAQGNVELQEQRKRFNLEGKIF